MAGADEVDRFEQIIFDARQPETTSTPAQQEVFSQMAEANLTTRRIGQALPKLRD